LHLGRNDVAGVLFDAVLVGELAVFQPAFDVNRTALLDVLAGDFSKPVIKRDAMPLRVLHRLTRILVLASARRGKCDVRHSLA